MCNPTAAVESRYIMIVTPTVRLLHTQPQLHHLHIRQNSNILYQMNTLTPSALTMLFRGHNDEYPGILCVMNLIWCFTLKAVARDRRNKRKIFSKWEKDTIFTPKPSFEPTPSHWSDNPVHEYNKYHGKLFVRRAHSIGVTLATQAFMNGKMVFVVWTYNRKAYIFNDELILFKVLNRQNSPFDTWMKHLDGKNSTEMEHRHNELRGRRSSDILFHDLVVPLYGKDPMLRDPTRMRGINNSHPIWVLIKEVSDKLSIPNSNRKVWHDIRCCGPYSDVL